MAHPVRHFLVLSAVLLGRSVAVAQEPAPAVEVAEEIAALKRERAVSPRVAALIAASRPKYEGPRPVAATPAAVARDKPANGIVRLPDYIVREQRLPTPDQVMTQKAVAQYAMNKYLGPSDGFDRGLLNAFTIADLRKKMGVLGYLLAFIPSMTNEERAMMYYYEDKRLEDMKYLTELASLPGPDGDRSNTEKLRREVQNTFRRK